MCLWLLKFTPSAISRAHAITIIHLVSLVVRNKIFLECGKEKRCSMAFCDFYNAYIWKVYWDICVHLSGPIGEHTYTRIFMFMTTKNEALNRFNSDNVTRESFGNQGGRTNVVKEFEGISKRSKPCIIFKKNKTIDSFVNIHEGACKASLALCPASRFQSSFTWQQS